MNKEKNLYRILFLISIFLLIVNDFYLKYEYHNYLTGKISDFAGLFAFPYFLSCFLPRRVKLIYILSGVVFVIWKLEISQPLFELAHFYGIGIDRTVDNSDLISLIILPFSYHFWKNDFRGMFKPNIILKPILIGIYCFAFVATTLPQKTENYNFQSGFEVILKTDSLNVETEMYLYESEQKDRYLYVLPIPERKASITTKIELEELQDGFLKIKLDSILNYRIEGSGIIFYSRYNKKDVKYLNGLTKIDIEELFSQKIKEQLNQL